MFRKIKGRDLARVMRRHHALWLEDTLLRIGTVPAVALADSELTEAQQRKAERLIRKHYRIP